MLLSAPDLFLKTVSAEPMSERFERYRTAVKDPRVRALLDTISYAEGTSGPEGYRTMFTGKTFDPTKTGWEHPRQINVSGQYRSDAAGRYQQLSPTYDMARQNTGTTGFTPEDQDLQATYLLDYRGVLDPLLQGQGVRDLFPKMAPEWASFPTKAGVSAYEQPVKKAQELQDYYNQRLTSYGKPMTAPPPAVKQDSFGFLNRFMQHIKDSWEKAK
jgi:muramidase (phage lysozyme)